MTTKINLSIPDKLYEELRTAAFKRRTTQSEIVRQGIRLALDKRPS